MITGIICEFNPFHRGHKHLIDTVREKSDGVVCVMSGNFVQRGEFAVYDKFTRARSALENGADLVLELPCAYSLMSAKGFGKYAVQILEKTGIIDEIAFGAECDDIKILTEVAEKINSCQDEIKVKMKEGLSYPVAVQEAVGSDILNTPNNILAVEYISETNLPCRAVKRIGKGHDTDDEIYSASAIRQAMSLDDICSMENCQVAILSKLRTMSSENFLQIDDVTEGLENRIVEAVRTSAGLDEIYDKIKTKRYTHSRIRRIILRAYLDITSEYTKDVPYIRVLGFNSRGKEILAQMKKSAALPIISRYADIKELSDDGKRLLELECKCTDLYNLGYKKPLPCGTEQRSKIIII